MEGMRFGEKTYPNANVGVRRRLDGDAELDVTGKVHPIHIFPKKGERYDRQGEFEKLLRHLSSEKCDVMIRASLRPNSKFDRHAPMEKPMEKLIEDKDTKYQLFETQIKLDQDRQLNSIKAIVRMWDGQTDRECSEGSITFTVRKSGPGEI